VLKALSLSLLVALTVACVHAARPAGPQLRIYGRVLSASSDSAVGYGTISLSATGIERVLAAAGVGPDGQFFLPYAVPDGLDCGRLSLGVQAKGYLAERVKAGGLRCANSCQYVDVRLQPQPPFHPARVDSLLVRSCPAGTEARWF
jgi:hypothetical protein